MADPGNSSHEPHEPHGPNGAEFSPAELDRLEDALESWTGEDFAAVPEDSSFASSLPASVRARLADYRDVLVLSREALALEDVPDGLLASVLEEAHASAASVTPIPARRAPAGPSLWERLRRSLLLPGVALAGSTVMLLWLVQPRDNTEQLIAERSTPSASTPSESTPSAAPAPAPELARLAPGDGPAPAGPMPAEPAPAALEAADKASDTISSAAGMGAPRAEEAAPEAKASSLDKGMAGVKADAKPSIKRSKDVPADDDIAAIEVLPGLDDAPTQDLDKEALRDTLEQADTRRRSGRCDLAMALYKDAFTMSGPTDEQARARAGYGLCLASQGEDDKAEKYFDYATKRSPGMTGWIARERGEGAYTKKARKPSPAKSKVADPL